MARQESDSSGGHKKPDMRRPLWQIMILLGAALFALVYVTGVYASPWGGVIALFFMAYAIVGMALFARNYTRRGS